jgi:hypothetical protein
MLVRFLRRRRWLFVLATVAALAVQISMTMPEMFKLGTWRYGREVCRGVVGAFRVA